MTTNDEDTHVTATATKINNDPDVTDRRTLWSGRALHRVLKMLREDKKVAEGGWTKKLTESMQRMNEPLRDDVDEDKLSTKRAKDMLLEARRYRRERDELEEEKKDDLKARGRVIAGFEQALDECLAIESDGDGDQLNLLEGQSGIPGMSWASAETVRSIYGAIKPVTLNLTAGEAIENDVPVPAANDDAADTGAPAAVPF
jgi:hypothetical protein